MITKTTLKIPTRSKFCHFDQVAILPGQTCHSILEFKMDGLIVRKDFCKQCWDKVKYDYQAHVAWKFVINEPLKKEPETKSQTDTYLTQFRNLLVKEDPNTKKELYFLSIILTRLKKLHIKKEFKEADGTNSVIYHLEDSDEILTIEKIPIDALPATQIYKQLTESFAR